MHNTDTEVREILIKDLPDSYEKEQLSSFCIDPETSHVHVVARMGALGTDWAAYIGWPDLEHLSEKNKTRTDCIHYAKHQHDFLDVLAHGDKLSSSVAAVVFPEWASKYSYRR